MKFIILCLKLHTKYSPVFKVDSIHQTIKDGNVTFRNVGINDWITLNWHHMEGCHFKPGRQQITMILKNLRINDTG